MGYGKLTFQIERLLKERGISKNKICKDLDIPRANFNRYCRQDFQRLDAGLICKLCWYLKIDVGQLIEYTPDEPGPNDQTMQAIKDARNGIGLSQGFSSVRELMDDLNTDQ